MSSWWLQMLFLRTNLTAFKPYHTFESTTQLPYRYGYKAETGETGPEPNCGVLPHKISIPRQSKPFPVSISSHHSVLIHRNCKSITSYYINFVSNVDVYFKVLKYVLWLNRLHLLKPRSNESLIRLDLLHYPFELRFHTWDFKYNRIKIIEWNNVKSF